MKVCDGCGNPATVELCIHYAHEESNNRSRFDGCKSCGEDFVELTNDFFNHKVKGKDE